MSQAQQITVIGASGNIGQVITQQLLEQALAVPGNDKAHSNMTITLLTRTSSLSKTQSLFFKHLSHPRFKIQAVDDFTSLADMTAALRGQDTVISTLATFTTVQQHVIIDAAVAAGVRRFVPSEYGVDTSDRRKLERYLPPALIKHEVVAYLKTHEDRISWTAVIVGAFFDWSFQIPGMLGWDVPARKAMLVDGGDVAFEVTNLDQIARAVVRCVAGPKEVQEKCKNQYVYVNSFSITQKQVLALLEEEIGEEFEITHVSGRELSERGRKLIDDSTTSLRDYRPTPEKPYADGSVEMITAALLGYGGINTYSKEKGLWNAMLGLPVEKVEETVKKLLGN